MRVCACACVRVHVQAVFEEWKVNMAELASCCPNVMCKLSGLVRAPPRDPN